MVLSNATNNSDTNTKMPPKKEGGPMKQQTLMGFFSKASMDKSNKSVVPESGRSAASSQKPSAHPKTSASTSKPANAITSTPSTNKPKASKDASSNTKSGQESTQTATPPLTEGKKKKETFKPATAPASNTIDLLSSDVEEDVQPVAKRTPAPTVEKSKTSGTAAAGGLLSRFQAPKTPIPPSGADTAKSSSASSILTPPPTSDVDEADGVREVGDLGSDDAPMIQDGVGRDSSISVTSRIAKRRIEPDSDEEEDVVVGPRKKRASIKKVQIEDDEDDEDDAKDDYEPEKPKPAKTAKSTSKSSKPGKTKTGRKKATSDDEDDDDEFTMDVEKEEEEDYFDDDLDNFIVDDAFDEMPKKASKKGGAGSSSAAPKQSKLLPSSSARKGASSAEKKKTNEEVFSFLRDIKDADGNPKGSPNYDPRTLYVPDKAFNQLTPFEKQFWEIKKNHYDTILLFQKGKFYELYEDDALIGHQEFDLKLTDRVKMKMVGVPEASVDYWISKFLAKGYKVGRVDQAETAVGANMRQRQERENGGAKGKGKEKAANGKGDKIVVRELRSVFSGGTIVDGNLLTEDLASHCVSIKEYIASPTSPPVFGICVLDAATANFELSQFQDDICRTKLETLFRQLRPKEIIHEKGNLSIATLRVLKNIINISCQWTSLKPRTEFLERKDTILRLGSLFSESESSDDEGDDAMDAEDDERGDGSGLLSKEVLERIPPNLKVMFKEREAMNALGGLIWYLRQLNLDKELVTTKNFDIFDPIKQGSVLVLDGQTLAHIEVLTNSHGTDEGTLLKLLCRCITPFGKRQFKTWVCQPLREAAAINARLDFVEDLMNHPDFEAYFEQALKGIPDLDRVLSRIHAKTCKVKDFLKIVEAFKKVSKLLENLSSSAEQFKSQGIKDILNAAPKVQESLDNVQRLYTFDEADKDDLLPLSGANEEFDAVTETIENIETELETLLKGYQKKLGLKSKDIQYRHIGTKEIYQIEIPVSAAPPKNWTRMSKTAKLHRFWSPEVEKLVTKLKEARETKMMVIRDFKLQVYEAMDQDYLSIWLPIVKLLAHLDCLLSLAKASSSLGSPAVRPEIVESDTALIDFEELRHPCIISDSTDFIPNDIKLGGDAQKMILLTGPNMAGKSTLLRMSCIGAIMAQLGCYVPAKRARISPIDKIDTRMGAHDHIFQNASTFKVEMDDCRKILTEATPKSLVILDELGRGTSTFDGVAIAFAVLHQLATHIGCIGFFATHYTSLTDDFAHHPQIRRCCMSTQVDDATREVVFLYKIIDGISPRSYGGLVARMAGVNESIVERAISVSADFEQSMRAKLIARTPTTLPVALRAHAVFLMRLLKEGQGKLDPVQLKRTLENIRGEIKATLAVKAS